MIYSLSEIDATCKKAARGAGLSWGYAEEAGKAARWLAAHQLPGAALLAEYLTLRQKNPEDFQRSRPDKLPDPLIAGAQRRCPLLTGAGLCDTGHDVEKPIVLERIVYPLLLLPYLVQLSQAAGLGLRIQWPDTHIKCHDGAICMEENASIARNEAVTVSCSWMDTQDCTFESSFEVQKKGQFIEPKDWQALETLAHFTYVPATDESRLGAGPSD